MSDMFESLELNMRQEAERINPTKAIMASQLECEQRFESFVAKNPERVDFLSDDIRSVADKYAAEYDIPSEAIYEATVTHLKEAAVRQAEWDKPWTEEDESKEEDEKGEESDSEEEKEEEDEEEEKKEYANFAMSSVREAKECNCWDGYKRVPGTKPCTPGSCEKCDADREKKKAAFILENADELVPEWIQKNAGWREMLRGFMNRNDSDRRPTNTYFDPTNAPDWSSKDKPLPPRRKNQMDQLEDQEQPTVELEDSSTTEYERMLEDEPRLEAKRNEMDPYRGPRERYRRKEEMIEGEPEFKKRGPYRYDYLRGASVKALEDFYVAQGMPEKTASILVEAVGEMAQLQQNEPGLPVAANDPDSVSMDKEIGGPEGDKYRNINVEETSKAIGVEGQEFTDFGDLVREFVQPGGEAPYADNDERTEKNKDKYKGEADRSGMDGKGVKQEDNAPKQSSNSWEDSNEETNWNKAYKDMYLKLLQEGLSEEEADEEAMSHANSTRAEKVDRKKSSASVKEAYQKSSVNLTPPEGVRSAAKRGIKYHSEGKAGDGFESATLARARKIAEGQELTPEHVKRMHSFFERHAGGRSEKAKQGEVTPWDVAWLAWGGNAGRSWAASKVKELENSSQKSGAAPLDFDIIDNEVEKLMEDGMTPEQAIQSLGVYDDAFMGWGSSKNV